MQLQQMLLEGACQAAGSPPRQPEQPDISTTRSQPCGDSEPLHAVSAPQSERQPVPNDVILLLLSTLPPSELAFHGRRVCKAAAAHFKAPHHCTVALSQPLDSLDVQRQMRDKLQQQLPNMSLHHKLSLMASAAASGCEANLSIAWDALKPCLFSGKALARSYRDRTGPFSIPFPDPAVAALTRAPADGAAPTLGWLLQHCPLLVQGRDMVAVAAASPQCNLERLQLVKEQYFKWRAAVRAVLGSAVDTVLHRITLRSKEVALAAARSGSADSRWMVEWALGGVVLPTRMEGLAAAAAAGASDLRLLQWLRQKGVQVGTRAALLAALRQGDFATVLWLKWQARVEVPLTGPGGQHDPLGLCEAAAGSCQQPVQKLAWLAEQGLRPRGEALVVSAAAAGQVETVWQLHERWGVPLSTEAWVAAAGSGSLATAAYLRNKVCPTAGGLGPKGEGEPYLRAAARGDLAMVGWLAGTARCGSGGASVAEVIEVWGTTGGRSVWAGWGGSSSSSSGLDGAGGARRPVHYGDSELLAAVQLLVKRGWPWGNGGAAGSLGVGVCDAGQVALAAAVGRGDLPLVRWLHQQGCRAGFLDREFVALLIESAVASCSTALLKWLFTRGPCAVTEAAVAAATKGGNREVAAWLRTKQAWDDRRGSGSLGVRSAEMLAETGGVPAAVVSRLDAYAALLLAVCLGGLSGVAIVSVLLLKPPLWSRAAAVNWARAVVPLRKAR